MDALNVTSEIVKRYAIPESCREDLCAALRRVIADGRAALNADEAIRDHLKDGLDSCASCVSDETRGIIVINGDAWEELVHKSALDKSIDIGLLVHKGNEISVLPIEGKLGMSCEYQGDRGARSVRASSLKAKMNGFRTLLSDRLPLCGDMLILVPRNGQEWAWYLIRRWNLDGAHEGRFFSCCISDFLVLLGLPSKDRPNVCSTTMNAYRRERLMAEFRNAGPMSQVQLPMAGICMGCRRCRDACPQKAISIIPDDQNRLYPFVDTLSCKSGCRHCESVCPVVHGGSERALRDSVSMGD